MADPKTSRAARRRAQRRRRVVVLGTAGALISAGAGTAWALTRPSGPSYRLATAERSDVTQTVDADGSLSDKGSSTVSFAVQGSVQSVRVHVGDHVHAGETLATLDESGLRAAVTSARGQLAQARQRLADDEQAQLNGSSPSSDSSPDSSAKSSPTAAATTSSAVSADSADSVRLISTTIPKPPSGSNTNGGGGAAATVRAAQQAVEAAQRALDAAIAQVSRDVDAAGTACTSHASDPSTRTLTADADGTVSGTAGPTPVVATLLDTGTSSANPQTVAAGGSYSFAGLTAGHSYTVVLVPQLDTAACSAALDTLRGDQSDMANAASVVSAKAALDRAIRALDNAIAALASSGASTPTGAPTPTGSAPTGSAPTGSRGSKGAAPSAVPSGAVPTPHGSDSSNDNPSSSGTTVTAEQIAADTKAIDAARAQLAVAKHDLGYATLTAPNSGTVAAVNIRDGESVSASSSTATIIVAGAGAMSVDLDISLSDIDSVKVGQQAHVTVDGRSEPLAATVSYVGGTNTSSNTGSSSTYQVTVHLDAVDAKLFDGMGASVAIDVGEAENVLTVPLSAVQTVGSVHTVTLDVGGRTSTKPVTLGVEGGDRVQITSGLSVGDRVVLAEISKPIPSSNNNPLGGPLNGLNSGVGGGPVVKVGSPPR